MYGSSGVQDRCQYEANLEKKFCRTETSASMKPMLGPVRSDGATCTLLSQTESTAILRIYYPGLVNTIQGNLTSVSSACFCPSRNETQ